MYYIIYNILLLQKSLVIRIIIVECNKMLLRDVSLNCWREEAGQSGQQPSLKPHFWFILSLTHKLHQTSFWTTTYDWQQQNYGVCEGYAVHSF